MRRKSMVAALALTFLLFSFSNAYVDTPQQREQEAQATCIAHIDAYHDARLMGKVPSRRHLDLYSGTIQTYVQVKLEWLSQFVTTPATHLQKEYTITQEEAGDQLLVTVRVRTLYRSHPSFSEQGNQFQFLLARKGYGYQILDVLTFDPVDISVRGLGPQSTLATNPISPGDVERFRERY